MNKIDMETVAFKLDCIKQTFDLLLEGYDSDSALACKSDLARENFAKRGSNLYGPALNLLFANICDLLEEAEASVLCKN